MGWLDDITQAIMQPSGGDSGAAGAPTAILPPVAQTDPTPVVAGDPMVITPKVASAKPKDDWAPPAATMTPPSVANVPFGHSSGMIAPQPTLPMLGDILAAPQPRRQYPILAQNY